MEEKKMTANLKIENIQVIHAAFEDEPVYIANYLPGYKPTRTYKKYLSDETLEVEAVLEDVWTATQNIEDSWSNGDAIGREYDFNVDKSPNIIVKKDLPVINGKTYGHRSTSVGDYMIVHFADTQIYNCYIAEDVGFSLKQSNIGSQIEWWDLEVGKLHGSRRQKKKA
jgi:hypothetical protein